MPGGGGAGRLRAGAARPGAVRVTSLNRGKGVTSLRPLPASGSLRADHGDGCGRVRKEGGGAALEQKPSSPPAKA
eukprot:gene22673-38227_t